MEKNELRHWGIKGMKWGIRRFQNKDGSLTPAGKKRYDNDSEGDSDEKAKTDPAGRTSSYKPVKDMSDEELRRIISRHQLEQQYAALNPKTVSKGEKVVKFLVAAAVPALEDVTKQLMKSAMTGVSNKVMKELGISDEYKVHTNNKKKN